MKNHIKRLGKDSIIYGVGDALKRMVVFLLLPVYTRYLTPTDYGRLELLMVTLNILFIIGSQGMGTAFSRFYGASRTEIQNSELKRSELIRTSQYYLIFSSMIICGLLHIFSEQFSKLLFDQSDPHLTSFIKIIAFTSLFQIMSVIPFMLYRVRMQPMKFITVSLIGFFLQAALNVYFVVVVKTGVKGILLGNAISALVVVIINLVSTKNILFHTFSFLKLKHLLKFGLPLIPVGIFSWIMHFSDKFLLQKFATTHELGLYSIGSRFSNIVTLLIIGPFMMSWGAYCFQIATTEHAKQTFKIITTYFLFILCSISMGLVVLTPLVIKLMAGKQFWGAYIVVLPLVCANITYGMFYMFSLGINITKKTHYFLYIMSFGATLNIILNVIFIPKFGMIGAGFVSFTSNLVITIATYSISQRLYYIPFEKARFLKICSVFIVITGCSWAFQMSNMLFDVLFRILLIVVFFLSLYLVKFLQNNEINYIKRAYNNLLQQKGIYNKIKFGYGLIRVQ